MRRARTAAVLLVIALAAVAAGWLIGRGWGLVEKGLLVSLSRHAIGPWRIEAAHLAGTIAGGMEVDSVRVFVRNTSGEEREAARAVKARLRWRPAALLKGRLQVEEVILTSAQIWLSRLPAGFSPTTRGAEGAEQGQPGAPERKGASGAVAGILAKLASRTVVRGITLKGGEIFLLEGERSLALREATGTLGRSETGAWDLRITEGRIVLGGHDLPLHALSVSGVRDDAGMHLDGLALDVGDSRITGSLALGTGGGDNLEGGVTFLPLSLTDVARMSGQGDRGWTGQLEGDLQVAGRPESLALEGRLGGDVQGRDVALDSVSFFLTGDSLALRGLVGQVAGGHFQASGALRLDERREHHGEIRFDSLDPGAVLGKGGKLLRGSLAGALSWEGAGMVPGERVLRSTVELGAGHLGRVPIDRLHAEFAEAEDRSLRGSFQGEIGRALLEGELRRAGDGSLAGDVTVELGEGALLNALLGQEGVSARGSIRGELGGTMARPEAWVEGELSEVKMGGAHGDSLTMAVRVRDLRQERSFAAVVEMGAIRVGPILMESIAFRLVGRGDRAEIHDFVLRCGPLRVAAEGNVVREGGRAIVTASRLDVHTGDVAWEAAAPLEAEMDAREIHLHPLRLGAGNAQLTAEGRLHGDEVQATVHLRGLELRRLGPMVALGGPVAGEVDLRLDLAGSRGRPIVQGELLATGAVVRGLPLREVAVAGTFAEDGLTIERGTLETAGGTIKFAGSLPLRRPEGPDGELRFQTEDLRLSAFRSLAPALEKVEGRAGGTLAIQRLFPRPRASLDGEAHDVRIAGRPVGNVRLKARLVDSLLTIEDLGVEGLSGAATISGQMPVESSVTPPVLKSLRGPVLLEAHIVNGDLALVPLFVPGVQEAEGQFEMTLRIGGTADAPLGAGEATITQGVFVFPKLLNRFENVTGHFLLRGNQITVERVESRQGDEGKVTVTGEATLEGLHISSYRLLVKAAHYSPLIWREVDGTVNAEFTMTPHLLPSGRVVPHLEGQVDVEDLLVRLEFPRREPGVPGIERAVPPVPPQVTFALQLHGDNNLRIQNKDVSMELQGEVFAQGDENGIRLLGTLESLRGRYFFYNHSFDIQRGVFTFSDIANLENVGLDVLADTRVGGEKIEVTLTGSLQDPQVQTTSENGWSESEIFRALTLGAQSGTGQAQGGFSAGLVDSWRQALLDRLGGKVARDLGVDDLRLRSGATSGEAARLEVGKRWSDVYLDFQYALGPGRTDSQSAEWESRDPERVLSLEYRLSDRFLLDGEAGVMAGVEFLNMDLKFKWSY